MHRGANRTVVAGVDDNFDVAVARCDSFENRDGSVGRCVVDENMLVLVPAYRVQRIADAFVKLLDILFFVVAARQDTNALHVRNQSFRARSGGTA